MANVYGNKGGVAISFLYDDTSLCFVNCHLAAHQGKTESRNGQYSEIVRGINRKTGFSMLRSHHALFWLGDLNYRIDFGGQGDEHSPTEENFSNMVELIERGHYQLLLAREQLKAQMEKRLAFGDFKEAEITFAPTFKVLRNATSGYLV